MNPVKIGNETRCPGKPKDWDESLGECSSLSIHDSAWDATEPTCNLMTSAWKPTAEELQCLINGGHVFLGIYGVDHPVVHLYAA